WFDGKFVEWREANVHVLTNTLHYGLGIFEGIRAYATPQGPAIFRLPEHIQRFFNSAKIINIDLNITPKIITQACVDAVSLNKLDSAYIRPMAFLGSEGMGLHAENLKTHIIVAAWNWGPYLGAEVMSKGIRVKTSNYRRNHSDSTHAHAKINGCYVTSILALKAAKADGYDEALMLDHHGFIAEGSGENFFMVKNGEVLTPFPPAILPGITRDTIMTLCQDLNIPMREANLTRDDVYLADEAFFTGTAAEVTPIYQIDHCTLGQGGRGPITTQLQTAYFDLVQGKNKRYQDWINYVEIHSTD
ncbi:unnamed protein product, partial [marine sediment metagenome]